MQRLFVCLIALVVLPASLRADDWPQLLGPRRDGVSQEKGLLDSFPKSGPKIVWQRDVGEGFSGIVIKGERAIVFHRVENDDVVECVNAVNGKEIWKFAYPRNIKTLSAKAMARAPRPSFMRQSHHPRRRKGCALSDAGCGQVTLGHSFTKEYKTPLGYFGIGTSPIVEQNLVLVNVGGAKAGIVAFDLDNGKKSGKRPTIRAAIPPLRLPRLMAHASRCSSRARALSCSIRRRVM